MKKILTSKSSIPLLIFLSIGFLLLLQGLDLDRFAIYFVPSLPAASHLEDEIGTQENNIFFIETNNKKTEFHPKLLCAFESAAMHNSKRKVMIYLHFFF